MPSRFRRFHNHTSAKTPSYLGVFVVNKDPKMSEERTKILQMVADGKISADEASRLLAALDEAVDETGDTETDSSSPPVETPRVGSLWLIPMYLGLAVFVCGALFAFPAYATSGSWLFAVCGWPLFVIGLLTMVTAYAARNSRWIHIRVTNVDGGQRNIKLSFPLPLRLSAWALKFASRWSPRLKDTNVDELIVALNDSVTRDEPLFIDVQEGADGERVQVYIG